MKNLKEYINEGQGNATFALSLDDLDKILYSLAFTAGWGDEVSNYNYEDYKKLFYDIRKGAEKAFDDAKDRLPEKWYDYELAHRGQCRHLD